MLEIRHATARDADTLLRFIRALAQYERLPGAVQVDAATLARQLDEAHPPFECLIAELAGEAVGFALYFHTYSTWLGKRGLWLEDLFVLPEHRRKQVGRTLLQRVAQIAVERDCGRLEWSVLDWNEPAIGFYRSLGAELMKEWIICRTSDASLTSLARGDSA